MATGGGSGNSCRARGGTAVAAAVSQGKKAPLTSIPLLASKCPYDMSNLDFEILGRIEDIRVIARGSSVRERARLKALFGRGRWRKLKGTATVRLRSGAVRRAELHWYEAHGIGKRKLKIKRFVG